MSGIVNDASVGVAPADASKLSTRATAGKIQHLEEAVMHSPSGKPQQHTPLSEPSTAPGTPLLSFSLDGEGGHLDGHHSIFFRCISGTSTIDPVMEQEHEQDGWDSSAIPPLPDVRCETEEILEAKLVEVKELYNSKFDVDIDEESDEEDVDQDGTAWIKTEGTGIHASRLSYFTSKLDEVKHLYEQRFGKDVDEDSDSEFEYDADGTPWVKTTGTGPLTVEVLEDRLAEVKQLFQEKYGKDADDSDNECDYEYDEDGTLWMGMTGSGPLTMAKLEDKLADVKDLYEEKFGCDIDAESDDDSELEYDADGTPWIKTVGTGPLTVERLEDSLAEVKQLYEEKFGRDIEAESDDDSELEYDADGTPWIKTVGTGPLTVESLEDSLAEVKQLYRERYGKDADESDEECEYEYDQDGTLWMKMTGTGPLTVAKLEDKLADVKDLFMERFGRDVDDESDEDSELEYDADGTPWISFTGQGPLTMSVLEDSLDEVKALFREQFGEDVDEDSDSEGQIEFDQDGTPWIKTVGKGPLTVEVLEDKIDEVKELYEQRFGRFVDEESDDEEPELLYDQDGTLWFKWEGQGADSCSA